jgi:hypothetical protein
VEGSPGLFFWARRVIQILGFEFERLDSMKARSGEPTEKERFEGWVALETSARPLLFNPEGAERASGPQAM